MALTVAGLIAVLQRMDGMLPIYIAHSGRAPTSINNDRSFHIRPAVDVSQHVFANRTDTTPLLPVVVIEAA